MNQRVQRNYASSKRAWSFFAIGFVSVLTFAGSALVAMMLTW